MSEGQVQFVPISNADDTILKTSVKIKHGILEVGIKEGDTGIVTAYLPGRKTFAVLFGPGKWVTWGEDEKVFLDRILVDATYVQKRKEMG